jgi:hypothetical protein
MVEFSLFSLLPFFYGAVKEKATELMALRPKREKAYHLSRQEDEARAGKQKAADAAAAAAVRCSVFWWNCFARVSFVCNCGPFEAASICVLRYLPVFIFYDIVTLKTLMPGPDLRV